MDRRTLRLLELDKVLRLLAERTATRMGREMALSLQPVTDRTEVERRLRETSEAKYRLRRGNPPFGGIEDVRDLLSRACSGIILEPHELVSIARTLEGSAELKRFLLPDPRVTNHESRTTNHDHLTTYANEINELNELNAQIRWCIGEEGEVLDRASDKLRSLRRQIAATKSRLHQKVNAIVSDPEVQKMLQEPIVTFRNGRYCLPVKANARTAFRGIVHDKSASGLTFFIEPEAIVEMGNELRTLESDESQEVRRILRELSHQVVQESGAIEQTLQAVAKIDLAFAKAKLSVDLRADEPLLNTDGIIELRRARHPLLPQESVVPIDFRIGMDFDVLVITGPNTGGKTVTLKTVGLLTLMAQCGLHVPAQSGSRLSIFAQVFADIGDEQSIEQSLSTFSSHMTHIAKILRQVKTGSLSTSLRAEPVEASGHSLVLLDEIGAGTDPNEGAALAKAILLHLHRCGAKVVCTTHFGELKTFAYTQPRFENASVLFDNETLKPTYELKIGVPGSSNAFIIAERLGLSKEVVEEALKAVSEVGREMERLLIELEQDREQARQCLEEAKALRDEARQLKTEGERMLQELRREGEAILDDARQQADAMLSEAEAKVERLLQALREAQSARAAEQTRNELRELRKLFQPPTPTRETRITKQESPVPDIHVGAFVTIPAVRATGKVVDKKDSGELLVQVGGLNFWVPASEVELAPSPPPPLAQDPSAVLRLKKFVSTPSELDIRGKSVDEVLPLLEKFLDDALLAGKREVRIIHGRGLGVLREAVHNFLREHPHVASFELAPLNQGGDGATIVKLKSD